jgi:hypothetical protein
MTSWAGLSKVGWSRKDDFQGLESHVAHETRRGDRRANKERSALTVAVQGSVLI